jgi:hypothetical protein
MKSKLIYFVIVTLIIFTKKSYLFLCNEQNAASKSVIAFDGKQPFDSTNEFLLYRNLANQNIDENAAKAINLKQAISSEDIVVFEELQKQLEEIIFKNNQLKKSIQGYQFKSVHQFQYYKSNFDIQLADNNQLIADILFKHQLLLKPNENAEKNPVLY